jgi:cob(I)alamin adenosyltransferase
MDAAPRPVPGAGGRACGHHPARRRHVAGLTLVKLNKIYTRTGDSGTTGLADGSRIRKDDPRSIAIGEIDETNSAIGVALTLIAAEGHASRLRAIQNELFDLGADLATPGEVEGALRIVPGQVERLEREVDAMNADLQPLTSFILPGGSPAAAAVHMARSIARRAERAIVAVNGRQAVNADALAYVNRLSDHLFVTARHLAQAQGGDVLWQPGGTR